MKVRKERIITILKITFGIMLLSVMLLFFFGEIFMPRENPTGDGKCVIFEANWERVFSDGTREQIELPGQCEANWGETVRLETILPEEQDNTWLCMRASQQDMRVYINGELRKEYSTKETRLFGRNSVSAFVFFDIYEEDAGKILAIELISDSEYTGFLNEVYKGDKYDIFCTFLEQCSLVMLVSIYMLILSSITVLVGSILRFVYKTKIDITYLGIGLLQLSLTMIAESRMRQFFLPNSSVASYVGFLLTMLIPYPFIVYVSRIQKGRYEKAYRALSVCVAANFLISFLLQLFGILDLADYIMVSYGIIIIMVIMISVTIGLDIKYGKIREYGEVIFGLIVMIVVSIWETYLTFVPKLPHYGGVALSIGLIILLFMAGFKTARDLLDMEKEKQRAIVAGETKTQFLANMSHEIRTPINTIIGMNEMILRENRDETVEEYAHNVQNASSLLLGLINDILDFSKIEAGKLDILEGEYYLSKMLTDVIKSTKIKADSKNLLFHVEIEESLPSVLRGDEIRIRQILNNLLSNAVKYTQQGNIYFRVKGISTQEAFTLCVSVEDTGMGIKPEDIDKLFDSFQRLEEKKNHNIEGTGLGLNITKQLAELMGGSIEVSSEYGKGSCFTAKIPQKVINEEILGKLADAYHRDSAVKEESKPTLYAPTARILVVDDNRMNLSVAKALLKRTGIQLTMAKSGKECLQLCRKNTYDLILMDHMMPELDGIETLHILRQDETSLNQNTEVIVLTANAITGMEQMYLAEGFSGYISKPIVAEELEDMICRHLPADKLEEKEVIDREEKSLTETRSFIKDEEKKPSSSDNTHARKDAENISYIDVAIGMTYCGNDEEMYQEMKEAYYLQGQKNLPKLLEVYAACDWENYRIIVHSLKSTSLVIGAAAFSEKARILESAAKEGDIELLLTESEGFFEEYKALLEQIK